GMYGRNLWLMGPRRLVIVRNAFLLAHHADRTRIGRQGTTDDLDIGHYTLLWWTYATELSTSAASRSSEPVQPWRWRSRAGSSANASWVSVSAVASPAGTNSTVTRDCRSGVLRQAQVKTSLRFATTSRNSPLTSCSSPPAERITTR